ncbi:GTPase [Streptomyces sp. NPDC048290]|uniref:GTPase n=1 Tax=Streptomyces sp. NPDC048290 TaxID=3155811 RepID=UPI0034160466
MPATESAESKGGGQEGDPGLAAAVADAVARSRPVAEAMAARVEQLIAELERGFVPDAHGDEATLRLLEAERRLRAEVAGGLGELLQERLGSIDTIDIALFGRTTVGKSSLIEAVSSGDGQTISPGESDFTTGVRALGWAACRMVDTPGIGGWDRAGPSARLEERARRAVVAADVVLLCFDSTNQQEDEFQKVAAWIAEYQKPVIAVLNCRNKAWRDPGRVASRRKRRALQRTVAEHAASIRGGLARIGLPGVPVVALHTQKAVAARATADYRGPYPKTVAGLRERVGPERLLTCSNLPVLENLLTTTLTTDAVGLRLGALTRQVRATLEGVETDLRDLLETPAKELAEQHERGIEDYLRILGAPRRTDLADSAATAVQAVVNGAPSAVDPARLAADAEYAALLVSLTRLETLRGGAFVAPVQGEAHQYARHLLGAEFGTLRDSAQEKADGVVERAFESRTAVTAEAFEAAVLDRPAIDRAAQKALDTFRRHVAERIELTLGDVKADASAVAGRSTAIDGHRGRRLRTSSYAAGFLGNGASIGLGIAALVTLATPVGWVLAIASGLTGLATRLFSRFGRKRAAQQAEEARRVGRTEARRVVGEFFDALRDWAAAECQREIRRAALLVLRPEVDAALVLREIEATAIRSRQAVRRVRAVTPETGDPTGVLARAVRRCETRAGVPGSRRADDLWLGADWVDDPEGLTETDEPDETVSGASRRSPSFGPGLLTRLRGALLRPRPEPRPGSGRAFLERLRDTLGAEPDARTLLAELDALAADPRPRIVVTGDYNTGKSSFVARLLLETGLPVPDRLRVAGAPETSSAQEYEWDGMLLIDTPGFQSGHDTHAQAARAALADAAVVIHLFTPSGFALGDRADLRLLLNGDPPRGFPAKLDRTLFVINRVDDLAPDPFDAPDEFGQLVAAQEDRLAKALERLRSHSPGTGTPSRLRQDRIVSVAAAPFETAPASAAGFDPYRSWDGFRDFATALAQVRDELRSNARDVTLLHGGLVRLGVLRADARHRSAEAERQVAQLSALSADLTAGAELGRVLLRDETDALGRIAEGFTATLAQDALGPVDKDERAIRARRCRDWSKDPEFQQLRTEWHRRFTRRVDTWRTDVESALQRRMDSPSFKQAFPDHRPDIDIGFLVDPAAQATLRTLLHSAESVVDLTKVIDAGTLQHLGDLSDAGDLLDPEAIPVETMELLDGLAGLDAVGGVVKVIHAVVELSALLDALDKEAEAQKLREGVLTGMRESAVAWTGQIRQDGLPAHLAAQCQSLDTAALALGETRLDRLGDVASAQRLISLCTSATAEAERALRPGTPEPPPDSRAQPTAAAQGQRAPQ